MYLSSSKSKLICYRTKTSARESLPSASAYLLPAALSAGVENGAQKTTLFSLFVDRVGFHLFHCFQW